MLDSDHDDDEKTSEDVRDAYEEKIDRLRRQYERDVHSFRYEIEERDYGLQAYAIVEGAASKNSGVIAKVAEILDGKLVISIEGDMEKRLIECEKSVLKKLKPGFQISVLPPTMEILDILPNLDVKSLLLGEKPNVTYKMIVGLSEAVERIRDVVILPFQEAKLFSEIKLEAPRGILLYGPPGCGKTLPVKAIATENDMTLFTRRGMMDPSGVHKNIIAQILSEMDGLIALKDVFVLGATNRADLVDPALLRPGRVDEILEIPRPTRQAAGEIVQI